MNITEYKNRGDGYKCYYGKATLKKGYRFVDGDEPFYALIGTNSCYSMTELLHPDDLDDFLGAVEMLGKGTQYLTARIRCYDQQYHYLYLEMRRNGRNIDGFDTIDMELSEFMELKDRYCLLYTSDLPSLYSKHMDTAFQEARIHKGQQVKR